jgi:hypothetical protein
MNMLLEKQQGTLVISAEKDFKVRGFEFSISGEERIEMKLEESYGVNPYYSINAATTTYKESNIFFSKGLSHFLNSIGTKIGAE